MDYSTKVSQLLLDCEKNGTAPEYGNSKIFLSCEGKDVFIVSDLHLTVELDYPHRTNYAADKPEDDLSFIKFLDYIRSNTTPGKGMLIINGDFIDFLRIIAIPESEDDFYQWQSILKKIGIEKKLSFLKSSISKREIRYGLNTNDYKSVWKLNLVVQKHQSIFFALTQWLGEGNSLIIIKGNHDLEFYWPAVRNFLRLYFAESLSLQKVKELEDVLLEEVLSKVHFIDDTLILDNKYYIEHGHKYDKLCHCIGGPVLKNKEELNIPFGSFFNRYLFNHIEIAHPPFKHVREKKNILPLLIEKRFFVGIKALLQHIPVLFLIIPMRYYRYLFGRVLLIGLTIFLPVLYLIDKFWNIVEPVSMKLDSIEQPKLAFSKYFKIPGANTIENMIFSFLSFAISSSSAYMNLEEHSRLDQFARKKLAENTQLKFVTFGHTHHASSFEENGRSFYNTGAWFPVPEEDKSNAQNNFTYLHIESSNSENDHSAGMFLKCYSSQQIPEPVKKSHKNG
jgi:UDP-2,3-diacylglucosamine pyrophosphatase LpxH